MTHGEKYLSILRRIIGPTQDKTFLDLCCGEMTHTRELKFKRSVHVDVVDWPTRPKEFDFRRESVLDCKFSACEFDVCLCSDGIEHLDINDGLLLIMKMSTWSTVPIIFTPLGSYMVNPTATDPDSHKSGWLPSDFERFGWLTEAHPDWHPTLGVGAFFAWRPK